MNSGPRCRFVTYPRCGCVALTHLTGPRPGACSHGEIPDCDEVLGADDALRRFAEREKGAAQAHMSTRNSRRVA